MRSLKVKILFLTLFPILLALSAISGLAINNKSSSEKQLLLDRLLAYQSLLESGDLSFDTVADKEKLAELLNERVEFSEILHADYSVVYTTDNPSAALITKEERTDVDNAFSGIVTIKNITRNNEPAFSIIAPLVVNEKVVGVIHQVLSNTESAARVRQYALFILFLTFSGLIVCSVLISLLLDRVVLRHINKLKLATIDIQKGNFNKEISVNTTDEIGELAKSFNLMSKKLFSSRQTLEAKMKELSSEHGKISSLVESVRLGVVMVDLNLNVILSNDAARAVFGKPTVKGVSFRDMSEKIKGSLNISQALSFYVRSGQPLNIQEVMIDERYYRLFMSPVRDIVQKIFIGAVMVMEDITEQKNLDKMRTEIVSITSHQLRTPATIIKGNLDMVLGGDVGKVPQKQRELLTDTYLGNERMIHLINDLMDASKIEEGKFVFPKEPVDFEELVAEVVAEVTPLADKKHVKMQFTRSAAPPPKASISRQKVKQVLQNLIDNAIKYSSAGDKGKVVIEVKPAGNFLEFSVKDNGIGIPVSDQNKIFERFARGSNSTRLDPGGGSGLGLYIAKAVVEQGGGKIWFDSKEGEGTAFFATFPIAT
jgi:two-component system sensor histidine kinase VicK